MIRGVAVLSAYYLRKRASPVPSLSVYSPLNPGSWNVLQVQNDWREFGDADVGAGKDDCAQTPVDAEQTRSNSSGRGPA